MKTINFALCAIASFCLLSFARPICAADADAKPADAAKAPDAAVDGEFTIGPKYADAPELKPKGDVPRGELHEFTMNSEDSKIYPGIAKGKTGVVPYQRKVCVYVPKQYVA